VVELKVTGGMTNTKTRLMEELATEKRGRNTRGKCVNLFLGI